MSKLRVNDVIPANGLNIGIGTAGGNFIVGGASTTVVVNGTFNSTGNSTFDGNVGINTTNPQAWLDVRGDNSNDVFLGGRNLYVNTDSTSYAAVTIKKVTNGFDYLQLRDASNTLKGQITSDGNWKPIAGGGIDFSATSDATGMTSELLDDYEEGTWTPTIRLDGGTANGTTLTPHDSIYKGRYVKIGDMVFVEAYVRYNFSTLSGTWSTTAIEGLPYTQGNQSSQQYTAVHIGYLSNFYSGFPTTNNNFPAGYVRSGQSDLILTINNPNGAETTISNSVLSSNSSGGIMFSAYYRDSASG